jgi:hypothetical protein
LLAISGHRANDININVWLALKNLVDEAGL